jgi:hypothetical protein
LFVSEKANDDDALIFQAVSELPPANRDTLAYLMVHLQKYVIVMIFFIHVPLGRGYTGDFFLAIY